MQKKSLLYYLPYMIVLLALISLFYLNSEQTPKTLSYDQLTQTIQNEKVTESVLSVGSNVITVKGTYTEQDGKVVTFTSTVPADENTTQMLLEELKGTVSVVDAEASNAFLDAFFSLTPILAIVILGVWMMNRMSNSGANAKAFDFGKSRARLETKSRVRFTDVAGADEEKQEMAEIIDYLKYPAKFKKMGARIPKGILLSGHPGTGKTLLAQAGRMCRFIPFPVRILSKCLSASAPAVCATCLRKRSRRRPASSLLTRLTRSVVSAAPVSAAAMMNVSRR